MKFRGTGLSVGLMLLVACEPGVLGSEPRRDASTGFTDSGNVDVDMNVLVDGNVDGNVDSDGATPDLGLIDAGSDATITPVITCAPANYPAGTSLRRRPYQQSITTNSAHIVWTTAAMGSPTLRIAPTTTGVWTTTTPGSTPYSTATTGADDAYVQHDAELSGLLPDTEYCYELLDGTTVLANGIGFRTSWTGTPRPLRILSFGDSGTGDSDQLDLRDRMLDYEFDIFLHLGDIAYESGTYTQLEERFFAPYRDILDDTAFFPSIGNHEYVTDEGAPYLNDFVLPPQSLNATDRERYYSFDYGNAHFVSIDGNPEMFDAIRDNEAGTNMVDWLNADLSGSSADWKIAFFHHPAYSSGEHGNTDEVLEYLVPVFEAHGIDLVLNGHDHDYERTGPVWNGEAAPTNPHAITYVVEGGGGAEARVVESNWFTAFSTNEGNHFLSIVIDGCDLHGESINTEGTVIDSFDLNGCD